MTNYYVVDDKKIILWRYEKGAVIRWLLSWQIVPLRVHSWLVTYVYREGRIGSCDYVTQPLGSTDLITLVASQAADT